MTHRTNLRTARLIATPATLGVRADAASITTRGTITGTGTTGHGMWTRAAS
ncbi:hypothetical protein LU699_10655 [Luteimonas fraxinea]|uniref:Uncharacterized protein n=1 Tax=Luteimonas fraxinea TaxID=2901869 RepID=A0ABS8UGA4_9GAMM|nr:hypothetical protein [Luteimonas fraxinea]MCD9098289.1 hypothetical protein [Luteimonas fraxinea]MCD9127021.1 hypothetical protein [Luteimonas fraxinea]UHH08775.1 hypothetical protein LU699_10655 [Luteimonas fraxinea]